MGIVTFTYSLKRCQQHMRMSQAIWRNKKRFMNSKIPHIEFKMPNLAPAKCGGLIVLNHGKQVL